MSIKEYDMPAGFISFSVIDNGDETALFGELNERIRNDKSEYGDNTEVHGWHLFSQKINYDKTIHGDKQKAFDHCMKCSIPGRPYVTFYTGRENGKLERFYLVVGQIPK